MVKQDNFLSLIWDFLRNFEAEAKKSLSYKKNECTIWQSEILLFQNIDRCKGKMCVASDEDIFFVYIFDFI